MEKIYLDPGHGGVDPGGVGNGLKEKDLVLTMAKAAKTYLEKNYEGHQTKLSRTSDTFPSLSDRTKDANSWGADCFVSLHTNAGGGKGYETFIYTEASSGSKKLSDFLHKEILGVMRKYDKNIVDRGQKKANFHVIRASNMPAALTETGFIDSSVDSKLLKNAGFLKDAGEAHAIGIANYLNLKKKSSDESDKEETKAESKKVKTAEKVEPKKVAAVANPPYPGIVFKLGSKGINVERIQRAAGMKEEDVDGVYGPKTIIAVKAYQKRKKLGVDGEVGPLSWNTMF